MVVRNFALVGGYYPFSVNESQFLPYIRSTGQATQLNVVEVLNLGLTQFRALAPRTYY